MPDTPDDDMIGDERPTVSKPINGPERGPWKPLLITIAVFAVLAGLYLLGTQLVRAG